MRQETTRETLVNFGALIGQLVNEGQAQQAAALIEAEASGTTVLADGVDSVHLVVPANIDAARVAASDEAYFAEIGRKALGFCYYEVDPA